MSLTSYRDAAPRVGGGICLRPRMFGGVFPARLRAGAWMDWKTWRRPTLPCLEAQYYGRWGFSRPSSGWDRVRAPRHDHQVIQSTLGASPSVRVDRGSGVCVCADAAVVHPRLWG